MKKNRGKQTGEKENNIVKPIYFYKTEEEVLEMIEKMNKAIDLAFEFAESLNDQYNKAFNEILREVKKNATKKKEIN